MNPLKLNITELTAGVEHLTLTVNLSDLELESTPEFQEPLRLELKISKMGGKIFLNAHVEAKIDLACDRCLKEYSDTITQDVRLVIASAADFEATDDENLLLLEKGEQTVNIAPLMREIVLLELPVKRLCAENCQGLCPNCGADLNVETCNCNVETSDPRWEALRSLLK